MTAHSFIPVCEPVLDGREVDYVTDAVRSGWISSAGPYLDRFEREFAAYCGARHAVAVCNGTAALQVAVRTLQLPTGSEVILPTFTIVSCAIAVVDSGLVPVFVDVEPDTLNLDPAQVQRAVTERTRAIMPVHMYGHAADMDALWALAAQHDLRIVEDAAEAHGGRYRDRTCGTLGDIATFSFYANKLVTTGEGGMVVTDSDELASRARSLRNLAFRPGQRFTHDELGWNFRMTNVQAAIGVAQLETAAQHLARRRELAQRYAGRLGALGGLVLPVQRPGVESTWWMHGLRLDPARGVDAVQLAGRLRERGVDTRPFFQPLHAQAPFARWRAAQVVAQFPVAEQAARYGLYLPSSVGLANEQVDYVCEQVAAALPEYARG